MVIVLGIDFGNDSSRIASLIKVNKPGQQSVGNTLTVIINESSERSNPCLITFKGKQRFIGDAAVNVRVSNAQNTISEFKMLIGKHLSDPDVVEFLKFSSSKLVENGDGELCSQVEYNNETTLVPVKTAVAYFFTKLKEVATYAIEGKKSPLTSMDAVISVPCFFDQQQRTIVMEAAQISGIQAYTVVSDMAAICMEYGFPKTDLPADVPVYVVFVLIGNAYTTVAVCEFKKDNFAVVAHASTQEVCGRIIDRRVADHFAKAIEKQYHLTNVLGSAKNKVRLLQAAVSTKKVLTGGQVARYSVENISDIDFTQDYRRADFEELIKDLTTPLVRVCEEAIKSAADVLKLTNASNKGTNPLELLTLHAVEILGGTSRIPLLKQAVESYFKRPLSTTLNSEDCVAKGCMLIAVQLSPYHRGRSIQVYDAFAQTTGIKWCREGDEAKPDKQKFLPVFKQFTRYPITQRDNELSLNVTFKRTRGFSFSLHYENPILNQRYKETPLSIITVHEVPQPPKDVWPLLDPAAVANLEKGVAIERSVRVRTTVKITGCSVFEGAFIEEDYEHEEKEKVWDEVAVEEKKKEEGGEKPEGGTAGSAGEENKEKDNKEKENKIEKEPIDSSSSSSTTSTPTATTSPSPPTSSSSDDANTTTNTSSIPTSVPTPNISATETPAPPPNTSSSPPPNNESNTTTPPSNPPPPSSTTPTPPGGAASPAPSTTKHTKPAKKYHYVSKKLKKQRRITLNSDRRVPIVTPETVMAKLIQHNVDVVDRDRVLRETTDAKNMLEQYTYTIREKIDTGGDLEPFIEAKEKADLQKKLEEVEEWMSEESVEDMQKSTILEKYNSLRAIGNAADIRFREHGLRPEKVPLIFKNAELVIKEATKPEKAHIAEAERNRVIADVENFVAAFKEKVAEQEKKPKTENPVFLCDDIIKDYQTHWKDWNKVLSQKPPPPPPPSPAAAAPAAGTAGGEAAAATAEGEKATGKGDAAAAAANEEGTGKAKGEGEGGKDKEKPAAGGEGGEVDKQKPKVEEPVETSGNEGQGQEGKVMDKE